jgi:hypothetical protein
MPSIFKQALLTLAVQFLLMQILQQILLRWSPLQVLAYSQKILWPFAAIFSGKTGGLIWPFKIALAKFNFTSTGSKKMFKNPLVAFLHFIIYAGFIIINIEVLEIVLDGIFGTHRLFLPLIGEVYSFLINFFEVLAISVIAVCIVFLSRRNILKLRRFVSKDLNGWPRSDANYILFTEIILMSLFLIMNSADRALQLQGSEHYHATGDFIISGMLAPAFSGFSESSLIILERSCWWLHIIGILAFLNYLPYSKHLHILLAFPNAYYARLEVPGKMDNMQSIQNEVLYAMQPELAFPRVNRHHKNLVPKMYSTLAGRVY